MTVRPTTPSRRRLGLGVTVALGALVLPACTSTPAPSGTASGAQVSPSKPTGSSAAPTTSSPTPTVDAVTRCVDSTYDRLTPQQRAGQLVMVALNAGSPAASLSGPIGTAHVGNVLYLGGWRTGPADVTATSGLLQKLATAEATGGVPLLVAADQEGGVVQQLKDGFTTIPSARTQATWDPAKITASATGWGRELKAAGINLNLAPVADTVPAALGRGNGPIGRWGREYGNDPEAVTRGSVAFLRGMEAAGVGTSIKHFPGIGRLRGNTDHTSVGLEDNQMTTKDPYLAPFAAGIKAGASTVMVSSATYPKIDPKAPAMFSAAIIEGILRTDLGYDGVVITDDINAVAVRSVPVPDRATRFVGAGGDIVLTGDTPSGATLVRALRDKSATDPAFATKVEASVKRVLRLKQELGLGLCH